jgi:hypothetical protein
MNERRTERLGEALALEFMLVRVHRVGDVHRNDEGEIDLGLGFRGRVRIRDVAQARATSSSTRTG